MPLPQTSGLIRTDLASMQIGDYISFNYDTTATGVAGTFSNLGSATGIEIPVNGIAIPNVTNGDKAYLLKCSTGKLICDRILQQSISWDVLNTAKYIEGKVVSLNSQNVLISSLSGGNSYADYSNKRIVSLLLHGDGTNGSTSFIDSCPMPKIWTANGSAMIKTSESKFGGSSMYFNGTTDWIDTPANSDFNFSSDDFTIDFWIKRSRIGVIEYVMGQTDLSGHSTATSFWINFLADDTLHVSIICGGLAKHIYSTNTLSDTTNWHHLALTRVMTNSFLYIDGEQWGTVVIGIGNIPSSINKLSLARGGEMASSYFQGYIDEVRIIKYKAEYTSNFTPPTSPYNEPTNTFLGAFSSVTDKGLGVAYPIENEFDKFLKQSTLGDKILANDKNVWNHDIIENYVQETPVLAIGANTSRIKRKKDSYVPIVSSTVATTVGFRPVLNYLEVNAKATDLFK